MKNLWLPVNNKNFILIFFIGSFCNPLLGENSSYRANKDINKEGIEISDWLIAVYMGARNSLAQFAAGNLQDMAKATTNKKINVVAQWDQLGKKGAWRYLAKNGIVTLDSCVGEPNPMNLGEKLVDFFSWAYQKYPAKKICLILWNHGVGPLDPSFEDPLRVCLRSREIFTELNTSNLDTFFAECEKEAKMISLKTQEDNRAILFDDDNKTYLSNESLKNSLNQINSILGRKIDCFGADACYMSALEICYLAKDYANYFIGSEELELAKGWNYEYWLKALSAKSNLSAEELISSMIVGFEEIYKGKTQLYTQSGINLAKMAELKQNHEKIIASINEIAEQSSFGRRILNAIFKARRACTQFTAKFYIDLHSFYKSLIEKILTEEGIAPNSIKDQNLFSYDANLLIARGYNRKIVDLITNLRQGMIIIENSVIKNVTSNYLKDARGISIYFPTSKFIDPSYLSNDFAKESLWTRFLIWVCELFQ